MVRAILSWFPVGVSQFEAMWEEPTHEVWGSETPSSSTSQLSATICGHRSGRRHGCRPNRAATRVATQAVSADT
jgi:hypothetical protein